MADTESSWDQVLPAFCSDPERDRRPVSALGSVELVQSL